ncbi:short-chain oxidoreductase [Colletotrichum plurivorum]|uniref:Short-chain oxidoreductase n=1 Tax=Colletotrichum plurivorum TaxID=2175906 RepID=A0A8H6KU60_9PEZI|nr:short-chain oxidoreductase [Colletotrichum plurivorum]
MAQDATTRQRRTWFVTGCSSGFGEALVRKLCAEGDNVIATGREADVKLAHLRDTGARVMDIDVGAPEDVIRAKVGEAWGMFDGGVDVVVNNAGKLLVGLMEEASQEEMDLCLRTNLHGPLNITRAFLPFMRERGSGTLLYISSQGGWVADPSAGPYCTSKFALEGAVESLAQELAVIAPGIKVLIVEPGYFRTKVFTKAAVVQPHIPEFAPLNAATAAHGASIPGTERGDPEKAVARMVELVRGEGMAAGREVPLRVPLGSDASERIRNKCEEMLGICRDWEAVSKSTDW